MYSINWGVVSALKTKHVKQYLLNGHWPMVTGLYVGLFYSKCNVNTGNWVLVNSPCNHRSLIHIFPSSFNFWLNLPVFVCSPLICCTSSSPPPQTRLQGGHVHKWHSWAPPSGLQPQLFFFWKYLDCTKKKRAEIWRTQWSCPPRHESLLSLI